MSSSQLEIGRVALCKLQEAIEILDQIPDLGVTAARLAGVIDEVFAWQSAHPSPVPGSSMPESDHCSFSEIGTPWDRLGL